MTEEVKPVAIEEGWSWGRFFGGFFSGRRYGKDFAILLRITLLAFSGLILSYGLLSACNRFLPKKPQPVVAQTHQAGPSTVTSQGGAVTQADDHSTDTKTVSVTINEAPFGKGLFGAFGSQAKVQGNEERSAKKK